MEIGARELLQFATLIASLAGAFAVVKSQLARATSDLAQAINEIEQLKQLVNENRREDMHELGEKLNAQDTRSDAFQATVAVLQSKVSVLSDISSVDRLEQANTQRATTIAELSSLRREFTSFRAEYLSAHNGSHKYIPPPKAD